MDEVEWLDPPEPPAEMSPAAPEPPAPDEVEWLEGPRRGAGLAQVTVRPIEDFDAPEPYGPEPPQRYEDMSVPRRAAAQLRSGVAGMDASTTMPFVSATARILRQMDRIDAGQGPDPNEPESGPVQAYRLGTPEVRARTRGVMEAQLGRSLTRIINAQARQQAEPRNPLADEITRAGNEGRWGDAWRIFRQDPLGIIQQFTVESVPASAAMMLPGVGTAAAGGGRMATGLAAYLGSAATEFGAQQLDSMSEALRLAGVDANDPAAVQAWVRTNPGAMQQMVDAAARGMNGPAIFDALTLGFGRGVVPGRGVVRNAGRVGANLAAEAAGEPAGAALGQVLAEGEVSRPGDLIGEFLGGVGQVAPTTAVGTIREAREARAAAPQTPAVGSTTPPQVAPPVAVQGAAEPSPPPAVAAPPAPSPAAGAPAGAAAPLSAPVPGVADTGPDPAAPPGAAAGASVIPAPAAPPAPVANPRAELEALLDDPRPLDQIQADTAAERAQGVAAMQAALPEGWSVVDEDGTLSVLDPRGDWQFQFEGPPRDVADLGTQARALHDEGLRTGLYSAAVRRGDGTRTAPVQVQNPGDVDAAAGQAQQPTPAQAEAGNYRKGHLRLHGLDLAIETPRGGIRSGVGADGRPWLAAMPAHYGEVKRTEGADGDPVDVYLGPRAEDATAPVFVVDQVDAGSGRFDEHKAMLGFGDEAEALAAYDAGFSDGLGPQRRAAVTRMSLDEFKAWLHAAGKGPVDRASVAEGVRRRRAARAAEREAQRAARAAAEQAPAGSAEIVEGVAEANGLNLSRQEIGQAAALVDQGMSPKQAILQVAEAAAMEADGEAAAKEDAPSRKESGGNSGITQSEEQVADDDTGGDGEAGEADAGAGGAPAEADREGADGAAPPGDEPREGGADTGAASPSLTRLAGAFRDAFAEGRAFPSIAQARLFAARLLGRAVAPGTPEAKMVDEAVEAGVVMAARQIVRRAPDARAAFRDLVALYGRQPRVGTRTSDSIERQAYSTPAPLAFLASHLAEIGPESTVLEPTAGTGMLLIGASPERTAANEIDPERRAILQAQGFRPTDKDASQDGVFRPHSYDAVIANPPFGAVRGPDGSTRRFDMGFIQPGYETGEIDHAIALRALEGMTDDGSAVLILGGVAKTITDPQKRADAYNGKAKREFFFTLYRNYRVVDHFTVAGELYAKQGAAWPVDVIVIRGRGRSDRRLPSQGAPRVYSEWGALEGLFDEQYGDERSGLAAVGQPADGVGAARGEQPGAGGRAGDAGGRGERAVDGGVQEAAGGPGALDDRAGRRPRGGDRRAAGDAGSARPVAGGRGAGGEPVGAGRGAADGQPAVAGLPEPADRVPGRAADAGPAGPGGGAGGAADDTGGVARSGVLGVADAFDEAFAELFGETPPPPPGSDETPRPARTAGEAAASAVKNAASGADDAMAALTKLFGGGQRLNMGLGWDEETWKAARPLFQQAIQKFRAAAGDVRQAMLALMRELRDAYGWTRDMVLAARPYMERFVSDVAEGRISLDQVDDPAPQVDEPAAAAPEQPSEVDAEPPAPAPTRERKKQDEPTDKQVPYEPRAVAEGVGTLVPVNMQTAISEALSDAERRANRPLTEFVADRLDYSPEEVRRYFSAEQIDAIALAIDNVDRDAGFVIGDQTGVGKGRFVAAMIRYAQIKGLVPIFVTEKPNLYADMARDLTDIGMDDALGRIVATNSNLSVPLTEEKGGPALKTGDAASQAAKLTAMASAPSDVIAARQILFTTYSQLQQLKGEDTARIRAIQALAPNAFVILDESHNAGGSGDQGGGDGKGGKGKRDRGTILRSILQASRSAVYSSATWAKRPDVMDLYGIKTDMRLAVPRIDALADAISRGGVPMQQIVSAMMARSGQYIRRERSFAGVSYDLEPIEVDRDTYNAVAGVMAGVFRVSKVVQAIAKGLDEEAKADAKRVGAKESDAKVEAMNFGSIMHNLINQMLLASKAPGTVRIALDQLERQQKPVIALANTMGSFIEEFANENGARPGDRLDLTFNSLLDRYLRKTLVLTEKKPFAKKDEIVTIILTPSDLGAEGERIYREVEAEIRALDLSAFPVSPIDYIRAQITKAGFTVGEITGRKEAADYRADGNVYYRRRPAAETTTRGRLRTISAFNNGSMDVIILNQSGATGLSLHASEKFKDQRKRVMLIAQAEANIDTHMQMLGRVHRTGQVVAPAYLQLVADVPAEKRPAAVLAKKMASLAASTTANRRGALGAEGAPDFINEFGDRVVAEIVEHDPGLWTRLGQPQIRDENDQPTDAARRVTGRIPLLPLAEQEALYEQIEEAYRRAIQMADEQGNNTLEAKTLDLDARLVEERPWTEGKGAEQDRLFAGPSTLGLYDVRKQTQPPALHSIIHRVAVALGEGENVSVDVLKEMSRERQIETLSGLAAAGEGWAEQEVLRVERTAREATEALEDKPLSEKERERAEQRITDQLDRLRALLREARPGGFVRVTREDETTTAMVLHVTPPKRGNRNAPGSWEIGLLFGNGRRMDVSAASVFTPSNRPQSGKDKGDVDHFIVENVSDSTNADEFLAGVEAAASDRRERRYIVTGNLLAGFAQKRGQIINFYDADGEVRQGIMLAADFDPERFEREQVPKFTWDQAMAYLQDRAVPLTAAVIETDKGEVRIARNDRGGFVVRVPSSKRNGAVWYLDAKLKAAVGAPFVGAGDTMAVTIPAARLQETMREIGRIATVERRELVSKATEAKAWLAARKEAEAKPRGDIPLYANPFDPALFDRLVWRPLRETLGGSTALRGLVARAKEGQGSLLGRLFRDLPPPPDTTIDERAEVRDVAAWERWFKTPERLFAKWPPLAQLVAEGIRVEQRMQVWRKRLTDEYEGVRTTLRRAKGDWQKVAEALYSADAEGVDLDSAATAREFYEEQGLTPAEATAAAALHRLLMKQGRLVDQHRRAMLPTIRARKAQVWARMQRLLNSAKVDSEEYAKLYRRRAYLNRRIREGKGDLAAQAAERDHISAQLRQIRSDDPEITAAHGALREEYDALEAKLAETSIRSRIKGYFPHKFYGQWRLFEIVEDEDGEEQRREITSDQGFYDSRGQAIAAARAFAEAHPGARLHIEPRTVSFPEALSGTPVSDANHRRISEALAEQASMSPEEVRDALKGVIRRRSRRRVLTPAMRRAGAEGFAGAKEGTEAEMADRVLRTHINQIVRYVAMDRLKARYVATTERMGLSPGRVKALEQEGRIQLFNALEAWWRDVNGAKQGFEQLMDGALQRMGVPGATLAAAAVGAAGGATVSPYVGAVLAGYAGYRMFKAMTKGGEFPTRAFIGGVVGDAAHLKLGMLVNIGSAAVNLTQTLVNTFPLLGAKWTAEGVKRAAAAMWSQSQNRDNPGRMSEDAHILRRLDVVTEQRYTEDNEIIRPALSAARRLSMFWFERAERINRATAALGAYHRALAQGRTPGQAFEEARQLMTRTQFHQGAANRPELLRQQALRIPTQFQNFLYQQIAFMFGLRGRAEVSRFLIALFLVAGLIGLPGVQILDWLLEFMLGDPPMLTARLWAIDTAARYGGGEVMTAMQVLLRGLPALAGVDISGRVGMGKGFGPERPQDLLGPTIGSLIRLAELTRREAPLLEQMGAVTPAATQAREVAGAIEGGARTSGARRGYREDRPTAGERARAALGLRPLGRSVEADVREGQREATDDRAKALDRYLARIVAAHRAGEGQRIGQIAAEARRKGVLIAPATIRRALRDADLDRATRDIRRAPRDQRPQLFERHRAVREFRRVEP